MKRILTLVLCMFAMVGYSQVNTVNTNINQGDLFAGFSDLSNSSLINLQLTPMIGYAITDHIMVGGQFEAETIDNESNHEFTVFGNYMLNSPFYAGAYANYASLSEDVTWGITTGYFARINYWLRLAPSINADFSDGDTRVQGRLGMLIALNDQL